MMGMVLGTGGPQAGVHAMRSDTLEVSSAPTVRGGHSVYAVDVDVEQNVIAGTRGGRIKVLSMTNTGTGLELRPYRHFIQGVSILSVCLMPDGRVLASDTSGRCLAWDPVADTNHPKAWETEDNSLTGGLLALPDNRIAGLTSEGTLLIWEASTGKLVHRVVCPRPPAKLALLRMRYWPAHEAIAYPAADGRLVIVKLGDFKVRTYPAHEGGFHAVIVEGSQLYTIGTRDGVLKTWSHPAGRADEQCPAPKGVISGDVVPDGSRRLVLVDENGSAAIYGLQPNALRVVRRLTGKQYRCVSGPSSLARHAAEERRCLAVAKNLVAQVQQKLDTHQLDGIEPLTAELAALGYESVSHGIAASRAAHAQDVIGELRSLHSLSLLVASKGSDGHGWLDRYASLLEFLWRLNEAWHIRNRRGNGNNGYATDGWLQKAIDLMAGDGWVVQPNADIPVLIQAATLLEQSFIGCWAIQVSQPVRCPDRQLTAQILADKYEQVRGQQCTSDLPSAEATTLSWLSPGRIRQVPAVVFHGSLDVTDSFIQLAIRVEGDGIERAIVPCVFFDAGQVRDGAWLAHNHSVLHAYECIASRQAIEHWPAELQYALRFALRRLCTKARSQWAS